ncbi:unnamed protein product, partial [Symbiodinium sp. CCMP2456]
KPGGKAVAKAKSTAKAKAAPANPKAKADPAKPKAKADPAKPKGPKAKAKSTPKAKADPKAKPTTPKAKADPAKPKGPKAKAKSTPKAKADPKAKPTTPKAKADPKAKPTTPKAKAEPKAKPLVKKRSMAEALTGEWINGLEPEESETAEPEETPEPPTGRRDRAKQTKFSVLLAAGAVPDTLKTEWEALNASGKRKQLTKFIEDTVTRDPDTGRLALSCDTAEVTGESSLVKKQATGWGDKGLPRTLFKGRFGLTDDGLRQAILNDEVGVVFCQWRTLRSTSMDERNHAASIKSDATKVSGTQAAQLAMLFESVSMERPEPSEEDLIKLCPASSSAAASAPPPTAMQAIEDKKEEPPVPATLSEAEWAKADELLKKAEGAVEKLKKVQGSIIADATKLSDKIKRNKDDPLLAK